MNVSGVFFSPSRAKETKKQKKKNKTTDLRLVALLMVTVLHSGKESQFNSSHIGFFRHYSVCTELVEAIEALQQKTPLKLSRNTLREAIKHNSTITQSKLSCYCI